MGERLELTDDGLAIVQKLAEGNIGAAKVVIGILRDGAAIDPDSAFGPIGGALALDTLDIYASRIWLLYKDVCDQDLVRMLGVLRAVQLGILSPTRLALAIDGQRGVAGEQYRLSPGEVDVVLARVREQLPQFGVAAGTRPTI